MQNSQANSKKKIHKSFLESGQSKEQPAGQTGVYRPVSQRFPAIYCRKTGRKGHFCREGPGHRPGVPGTPDHAGGFQKFYVIFSYAPFLLPTKTDQFDLETQQWIREHQILGLGSFVDFKVILTSKGYLLALFKAQLREPFS